jgi:hypothetical protein
MRISARPELHQIARADRIIEGRTDRISCAAEEGLKHLDLFDGEHPAMLSPGSGCRESGIVCTTPSESAEARAHRSPLLVADTPGISSRTAKSLNWPVKESDTAYHGRKNPYNLWIVRKIKVKAGQDRVIPLEEMAVRMILLSCMLVNTPLLTGCLSQTPADEAEFAAYV